MTKRIDIDQLIPGMYIVGLDRSWFRTPFLRHRRLIKDQVEIEKLRRAGVRTVTIDPTRGLDIAAPAVEPPPMPAPPAAQPEAVAGEPTPGEPDAQARSDESVRFAEELLRAAEVRAEAIASVQRILSGVTTGVPIDFPALRRVVASVLDRVLGNHGAMVTQVLLQQLRRAGEDLFVHAVDTCVMSVVIGKEHGLDFRELEQLAIGALLHDVGQMRLPQYLLQKRGVYTEDEHKLMQMHPSLGKATVAPSPELQPPVHRILLEHHERVDGSGYPAGLRGDTISLLAQIVGLVDRYDAMAGGRDGAARLPPGQAVRQLYQAAIQGQFDETLVQRLVQCLGVYPVGSVVELSTGERGVVVAFNSEHRTKPSVKLIADPRGVPYPRPWTINLSDAGASELKRSIRRIVETSADEIDVVAYLQD